MGYQILESIKICKAHIQCDLEIIETPIFILYLKYQTHTNAPAMLFNHLFPAIFLTATSCLLFLRISHRYLITLFMLYVTILYDIEHDISCINIAMYFGYSLKEK